MLVILLFKPHRDIVHIEIKTSLCSLCIYVVRLILPLKAFRLETHYSGR